MTKEIKIEPGTPEAQAVKKMVEAKQDRLETLKQQAKAYAEKQSVPRPV